MFSCDHCAGNLEYVGTDNRQEWRIEKYYCRWCNTYYERRTYFTQNGLVYSDEIKEVKEDE